MWHGNGRCNQENTIQQHHSDVHALTALLDNLVSNGAYMVIASLAWSLKAWSARLLPEHGHWQVKHREEKRRLLRMDFSTYRNVWMNIPAQIIRQVDASSTDSSPETSGKRPSFGWSIS